MRKGVMLLTQCAAFAAVLVVPSMAMSALGQDQTPASASEGGDVSSKLASAILADIGDRSTTASSKDLEGFIIYVISQGDYSTDIIGRALNSVGSGATGNMKTAVDNVRLALLKRKLNRGTAAILTNNGGGGGGGFSDFSAPGVSVGGGGANYTS